jgi:hypothetical protein
MVWLVEQREAGENNLSIIDAIETGFTTIISVPSHGC